MKLGQWSANIDITGNVMAEPKDIPHKHRNAEMLYASFRYSDKPFMGGTIGAEAARETIRIASLVFGIEKECAPRPR